MPREDTGPDSPRQEELANWLGVSTRRDSILYPKGLRLSLPVRNPTTTARTICAAPPKIDKATTMWATVRCETQPGQKHSANDEHRAQTIDDGTGGCPSDDNCERAEEGQSDI